MSDKGIGVALAVVALLWLASNRPKKTTTTTTTQAK